MNGYTWYEDKAKGFGEEYLGVFYACATQIQRNPRLIQIVFGEFRRQLTRRFPYAIYYKIEGNKVIVFGLFHCAWDPQNIQR